MELGEAEALGVLDDHEGGIGDVDSYFDDGGGDEDVELAALEAGHGDFFVVGGHAAVEEAEAEAGEGAGLEVCVHFGGGAELGTLGFLAGVGGGFIGRASGPRVDFRRFRRASPYAGIERASGAGIRRALSRGDTGGASGAWRCGGVSGFARCGFLRAIFGVVGLGEVQFGLVVVGAFDDGVDDVGLVAGGGLLADEVPDFGGALFGDSAGEDGGAAGGELVDDGDFEVAVEGEGEGAGDGGGGHDEDVRLVLRGRRGALRGGG